MTIRRDRDSIAVVPKAMAPYQGQDKLTMNVKVKVKGEEDRERGVANLTLYPPG